MSVLGSVLLALAISGCRKPAPESPQQTQPSSKASVTPGNGPHFNPDTLSDVVLHLLYTAREGGGVILQGKCNGRDVADAYKVTQPADGKSLQEALGEISAQQQNIYWRQSRETGVRVIDSKAQPGLLKVRVREFSVVEDLEPDAVMAVLWRQPEVKSFLRSHNGALVRRVYGARKVLSSPMILEVRNRTVAEILDRIAGAYRHDPPKVWIYQECGSGGETLVDVRMP